MSGRRVLVVDDDRDVVQMLTGILRKAGYDTVAAFDALQGVTRAMRDVPDVILLDIMMPAGGGFTVLERIRASTRANLIPVIILTGSVEPGIEDKARALGIHGFFHKPYDIPALLDSIKLAVSDPTQES